MPRSAFSKSPIALIFCTSEGICGVAAQKLILNVSKIRLRLIFARALHLLLICAKDPFSLIIFSGFFSLYGGLLHFVYYYFTETKCSTALFACIFLPLLLCSGGVFPLPLQKPQMHYTRSKKDTASIAVRRSFLHMYLCSPHTAGTGYGREFTY